MRKIAFDIDGTIVDLCVPIQYYIEKLYGVRWDPSIPCYSIEESTGLSRDQVLKAVNASTADLDRQIVYSESLRFISLCKPPILFVTNRWDKENTERLFDYILPNIPFWIEYTRGEKSKVLLKNNVTHFVEDNLNTANEVSLNGVQVYLLDKSYNQGEIGTNVIRVKNWEELELLFFCTEGERE